MEKLYWRPTRISRMVYVLVALIAIAGFVSVQRFQSVVVQPHFEEKLEAARLMRAGMERLREHRVRHVGPIDLEVDPTNSGMVGLASSSVTTNTGSIQAKRTTINPNWAAVVVELLYQAGAQEGDTIAVGFSGSFPALNVASLAAAEVLGLEVISIASIGASSWGANLPGLNWLDMERILNEKKIISTRSIAASLGGTRDRAVGMGKRGRRHLEGLVRKAGIEFIHAEDDVESIDRRMDLYHVHAGGKPIVAYVNVGGSLVSIGPKPVKRIYRAGLNRRLPPRAALVDSVINRFIRSSVPVINLSKVVPLAESYGLPIEPQTLPPVGEGPIFAKREFSLWLVAGALAGILLSLVALLRLNVGSRIAPREGAGRRVEPMI